MLHAAEIGGFRVTGIVTVDAARRNGLEGMEIDINRHDVLLYEIDV